LNGQSPPGKQFGGLYEFIDAFVFYKAPNQREGDGILSGTIRRRIVGLGIHPLLRGAGRSFRGG